MIAPEHKEEILQFINEKIRKLKQRRFIGRLLLAPKPNIASLASEIPQCAMNYKLGDIIDFLINAEQEGKIFF